jgi:hypothetical protein
VEREAKPIIAQGSLAGVDVLNASERTCDIILWYYAYFMTMYP